MIYALCSMLLRIVHVFRRADTQPKQDARDIFTGTVEAAPLVNESLGENVLLTLVRFTTGGRTKWHRHAFEQGLVIVEGKGIVATEEAEHVVEPGDVVYVPANEKHWHGGTETTSMAHIAINQYGETTVLEPVEQVRTKDY